jgi:PAS domain S-box-containing protein
MNVNNPFPQNLEPAQSLFDNFFEFSLYALVVTDGNGRITNVNSQVERVFGYTRAELLGLPVETLMPERFQTAHLSHRGGYCAHPSVRPMGMGLELYGKRKDGAEFPVDIMLSPVETAGGPIFVSVIRDVSVKKRAEEALRQSEQQLRNSDEKTERELRQIIDAIPQQVFVFDSDWNPLFANQRELEYTGLTAQEAQSKDIVARIFHPEDLKKLEILRERMRIESAPFEMEARIRGKDGEYRWFLIRDNPQRDEQGHVLRWYGTRTDIEDRKRAEEASRKAQADLERVNRVLLMGEMATSIAHEVNQPLTGIVAHAGTCLRWLAKQPPDMEEARHYLALIARDGNRAADIIGRIRALVKKVPPRGDPVDINTVILEVIALTKGELLRNSVELRTRLSAHLPLVQSDRVQLQQVILNLIVNAIEAMSGVSERPHELVVASGASDSNGVYVEVRDSGPGFDPVDCLRLFDSFYTTKPDGIGMGLSISRSIIEAHGGRLWATSNRPHGATFRFTLPVEHDSTSL